MQKQFCKDGKLTLRHTRQGSTLYTGITIRDELLIHTIRSIYERTGKSPSKILRKFVEAAFSTGFTPEI
jgi:hypothetical protein